LLDAHNDVVRSESHIGRQVGIRAAAKTDAIRNSCCLNDLPALRADDRIAGQDGPAAAGKL